MDWSERNLLQAVRAAAAVAQAAQQDVVRLQAYAGSKVASLEAECRRAQAEVTALVRSMRELEATHSHHAQQAEANNKQQLQQAQALRALLSHQSREQREQMREAGAMQALSQYENERLLNRSSRLETQRNALRSAQAQHLRRGAAPADLPGRAARSEDTGRADWHRATADALRVKLTQAEARAGSVARADAEQVEAARGEEKSAAHEERARVEAELTGAGGRPLAGASRCRPATAGRRWRPCWARATAAG